jgi:hypothetical protein
MKCFVERRLPVLSPEISPSVVPRSYRICSAASATSSSGRYFIILLFIRHRVPSGARALFRHLPTTSYVASDGHMYDYATRHLPCFSANKTEMDCRCGYKFSLAVSMQAAELVV